MKRFPTALTAVAALAVLGVAEAQPPLESLQPDVAFEGWRVIGDGTNTVMEGPYHYSPPGKHRNELRMEGQTFTAIVREDLKTIWSLLPQQNLYMELSYDDPSAPSFDAAEVVESRFVGTEEIDGRRANKYEMSVVDQTGANATGTVWATDEGIPLRMDMTAEGERTVIELRDVEVAPQPDALFEVPSGYTKLALGNLSGLAEAFGGLAESMGAAGGAPSAEDAPASSDPAEGSSEAEEEGGLRDVGRRLRGIFRDR